MTKEVKVKQQEKAVNKKEKKPKLTDKEIIAQLQKQIEEEKTKYLTSLADLENDRKRFEKSKHEFIKFSNESVLNDLINILDTFNMAMNIKNPTPEVKNFLIGFEMISNQFTTLLNNNGVEIIKVNIGDKFDSNIHSASEEVENSEFESGQITHILKNGYTIHKRLLRPAMVKIAK